MGLDDEWTGASGTASTEANWPNSKGLRAIRSIDVDSFNRVVVGETSPLDWVVPATETAEKFTREVQLCHGAARKREPQSTRRLKIVTLDIVGKGIFSPQ